MFTSALKELRNVMRDTAGDDDTEVSALFVSRASCDIHLLKGMEDFFYFVYFMFVFLSFSFEGMPTKDCMPASSLLLRRLFRAFAT